MQNIHKCTDKTKAIHSFRSTWQNNCSGSQEEEGASERERESEKKKNKVVLCRHSLHVVRTCIYIVVGGAGGAGGAGGSHKTPNLN